MLDEGRSRSAHDEITPIFDGVLVDGNAVRSAPYLGQSPPVLELFMKGEGGPKKNISGALIRKLRKRRDWTQKELSKLLREAGWKKCTRSWLSRIESGEVTLRDRDLPYFYSVMGEEFDAEFGAFMFRKVEMPALSGNPLMNSANLMNFVPVFLLSFSSA